VKNHHQLKVIKGEPLQANQIISLLQRKKDGDQKKSIEEDSDPPKLSPVKNCVVKQAKSNAGNTPKVFKILILLPKDLQSISPQT